MAEVTVLLAMRGAPEEFLLTYLQGRPGVTVTRRCADSLEVLAAALAGVGQVAIIDEELGVDRSFLTRLTKAAVIPIVVAPSAHHDDLRSMGARVIDSEAQIGDQAAAIAACLAEHAGTGPQSGLGAGVPLGQARSTPTENVDQAMHRYGHGPKLIGVISPWGAPGRTSLAVHLAAEYAERGIKTFLVDGDIWGSAVKQVLGLKTDTPGIAAAVRAIERGTLDDSALERVVQRYSANITVLGGLSKAERWREVSGGSLSSLWERLKQQEGIIIADGPVRIPAGSDIGIDGFGPRHNAVWDSLVEEADALCLVGSGDTVGIERLVSFYLDLIQECETPIHVVVNRVRESAAGPRASESVHELLARFAGVHDPILIPHDRAALDKATLQAQTLVQAAPRSAVRHALVDLSDRLHPYRAARRNRSRRRPNLRRMEHT